ncbi:MAG: hypothetical protein JW953_05465 [Anaerolineae bacterium]|nr:hypothetical protein [Anaerolineae bacterium]
MTRPQTLIIGSLAALAAGIFALMLCAILIMLKNPPSQAEPPAVVAQPLPATSTTAPTGTSTPPPTATAGQTALPTPTGTPVISQTTTPTPRPTAVNCIHDIANFEASGLITNKEVQAYLRQTIPVEHLDHCLKIRYVDRLTDVQATPASGRFMPLIRWISVYPVAGGYAGPAEILDTLVHEIGHNVHYNMRVDDLELANQWDELHQQNAGFVTAYASTDEFEDFAESYWAYVRQPQMLLLYNPSKYEFMRFHVFAGQEYPR